MDDRALEILSTFLKKIVLKRVDDVRTLIKSYKPVIEKCIEDNQNIPDLTNNELIQM